MVCHKFGEVVLAVKFREKTEDGRYIGGPMYYIEKGLGWKWLAVIFAFFGMLASFGIGNMVQANSVADSMSASFGIPHWITGAILAIGATLGYCRHSKRLNGSS